MLKPAPAAPYADESKEFVQLPPSELEEKAGAYRLVNEGRIWKLVVKDGDLHLIDHLHKAWTLKALSPTRFRPIGDTPFYQSARFLFARQTADNEYSMMLESNENGFHEVIDFQHSPSKKGTFGCGSAAVDATGWTTPQTKGYRPSFKEKKLDYAKAS